MTHNLIAQRRHRIPNIAIDNIVAHFARDEQFAHLVLTTIDPWDQVLQFLQPTCGGHCLEQMTQEFAPLRV